MFTDPDDVAVILDVDVVCCPDMLGLDAGSIAEEPP